MSVETDHSSCATYSSLIITEILTAGFCEAQMGLITRYYGVFCDYLTSNT